MTSPRTYYITRYATTSGVLRVQGVPTPDGEALAYGEGATCPWSEAFLKEADARAAARAKIKRSIAATEARLARLRHRYKTIGTDAPTRYTPTLDLDAPSGDST